MSRLRIWIDTDPALAYSENDHPRDVDDAFAIVEAIADEHVLVAGISSVFGNSPADVGFRVASELVRLTRTNLAVVEGAAEAGTPDGGFPRNPAAVAMANALREAPLSIVAIGPLTNVAALIQHFPEETKQIEQVVVVAGRSVDQVFELNGARGIPDFNFECDPHAARVLMEADIPVALTGFELTSQVVVTREQIESLRGRSPVADAIVEGALPWLTWWQGVFPSDAGFHPWDSAALAYLTRPELFVCEQRGWRIRSNPDGTPWLELGGDLPGARATYCPGFTAGGAEAFVREMLAGVP